MQSHNESSYIIIIADSKTQMHLIDFDAGGSGGNTAFHTMNPKCNSFVGWPPLSLFLGGARGGLSEPILINVRYHRCSDCRAVASHARRFPPDAQETGDFCGLEQTQRKGPMGSSLSNNCTRRDSSLFVSSFSLSFLPSLPVSFFRRDKVWKKNPKLLVGYGDGQWG